MAVLALGVVGLASSGCDIGSPLENVELVLDVEDANVNVGNVTTDVRPDGPSVRTQNASPNVNVKDVRKVRSIRLKTEFFSFSSGTTNSRAKAESAQASGTLEVWVFFGSYPLPNMPVTVTITDDVVTDVQPSKLNFGSTYSVDASGLNQLLEDLGDDAPDLAAWENATIDEVEAAINAALDAESSSLSIAVRVTDGNLSGSLTIDQFSFDAQVTK